MQSNSFQKRPCMPITYLIPPNKFKPSKKCLTTQKSAHPYTTQKGSPLWFLVNTLAQMFSTVPFSSVQHTEEEKSQQEDEKLHQLPCYLFIKSPRQLKLCGWVNCQGCVSLGRYEWKLQWHSVTTMGRVTRTAICTYGTFHMVSRSKISKFLPLFNIIFCKTWKLILM